MPDGQWTVDCNDVHDRPRTATVTINDKGEVCVNMPTPGTGCFRWNQLEALQAALATARNQAPGPMSRPS